MRRDPITGEVVHLAESVEEPSPIWLPTPIGQKIMEILDATHANPLGGIGWIITDVGAGKTVTAEECKRRHYNVHIVQAINLGTNVNAFYGLIGEAIGAEREHGKHPFHRVLGRLLQLSDPTDNVHFGHEFRIPLMIVDEINECSNSQLNDLRRFFDILNIRRARLAMAIMGNELVRARFRRALRHDGEQTLDALYSRRGLVLQTRRVDDQDLAELCRGRGVTRAEQIRALEPIIAREGLRGVDMVIAAARNICAAREKALSVEIIREAKRQRYFSID